MIAATITAVVWDWFLSADAIVDVIFVGGLGVSAWSLRVSAAATTAELWAWAAIAGVNSGNT